MFEKMKIRYLLALLFLLYAAGRLGPLLFPGSEEGIALITQLLAFLVVPLVFFGYYFRKQQLSVSDVATRKGFRRWIFPILGLALLLVVLSFGTMWLKLFLLFPIAPSLVESYFQDNAAVDGSLFFTLNLLLVIFIFPIVDEFIFRGAILKRLIAKTSKWTGILIASLLYSLLFADFFGAFVFSVAASLLYLKTNNLLIPIALNFAYTWIFSAGMLFAPPDWPAWLMLMETSDIYSKALPNALVLLASLLLTAWAIKRLLKAKRTEVEEEAVASV
ncbi:CPBP family intramembrane glutamic endopeptidase [Planococcus salinus]|uniref:CPBP family intramembrane metalloprotease n=1 Tax=Planococcus salinus TaxID=1848460 RepID=A0A3M8P5R3_9BACL|nr:CPBP family intramembrane glutamic endopeptidase [Planococcus salinus]RNF39019.1 CPBP family intramembrane metalloprotease [Planococcus salinus]